MLLAPADAMALVERGNVADFAFLSGDPLKDMNTTMKIVRVMKGAAFVDEVRRPPAPETRHAALAGVLGLTEARQRRGPSQEKRPRSRERGRFPRQFP